MSKIRTVQQHILDEERLYPGATGDFTALLTSLIVAAKIISREVNKAGLVKILGETDNVNVHGEIVMKLDEFAQHTICLAMGHSGHLCVMASEEAENIIPIPVGGKRGNYVLMFDPLDGSSNIDVNASIGTIFSIHRKITNARDGSLEDCLQKGSRQAADCPTLRVDPKPGLDPLVPSPRHVGRLNSCGISPGRARIGTQRRIARPGA